MLIISTQVLPNNIKDMKKRISKAWEAAKTIKNLWKSKFFSYYTTDFFGVEYRMCWIQ